MFAENSWSVTFFTCIGIYLHTKFVVCHIFYMYWHLPSYKIRGLSHFLHVLASTFIQNSWSVTFFTCIGIYLHTKFVVCHIFYIFYMYWHLPSYKIRGLSHLLHVLASTFIQNSSSTFIQNSWSVTFFTCIGIYLHTKFVVCHIFYMYWHLPSYKIRGSVTFFTCIGIYPHTKFVVCHIFSMYWHLPSYKIRGLSHFLHVLASTFIQNSWSVTFFTCIGIYLHTKFVVCHIFYMYWHLPSYKIRGLSHFLHVLASTFIQNSWSVTFFTCIGIYLHTKFVVCHIFYMYWHLPSYKIRGLSHFLHVLASTFIQNSWSVTFFTCIGIYLHTKFVVCHIFYMYWHLPSYKTFFTCIGIYLHTKFVVCHIFYMYWHLPSYKIRGLSHFLHVLASTFIQNSWSVTFFTCIGIYLHTKFVVCIGIYPHTKFVVCHIFSMYWHLPSYKIRGLSHFLHVLASTFIQNSWSVTFFTCIGIYLHTKFVVCHIFYMYWHLPSYKIRGLSHFLHVLASTFIQNSWSVTFFTCIGIYIHTKFQKEKKNQPILRKRLSDERRNGRTDERTDGPEFIGPLRFARDPIKYFQKQPRHSRRVLSFYKGFNEQK